MTPPFDQGERGQRQSAAPPPSLGQMACCQAALLLIIVTVAITSQFAEGQNCRNPVPGLDRQSRGVDVAILDLLPLDFTGQDGYKNRIFDYTCSQNKTMDINGVTYQVPDQVWSIDSVRGGWMSSQVNILKNYEEVKTSMSRNVGGGTHIAKFGFSSCMSYTQMQHAIVNTSHYIEQVTAFDSAMRIDFLPYWDLELGSTIQRFIDQRLPDMFEESPGTYEEFINYFGTHYFKSAKFGGLIMMYMRTSSEYYVGRSESDIKIQAEESFLNFLRGKASIDQSARAIDEQFRRLTSTTTRYYGGNTNLLSTSSLAEWQPTIMANPWLFSAELAPVSELITDSAKRLSMESAILNHLLYGYVQELERLLQAGRARWKAALSILDSLSHQLQVAKSARILNQETIEYLGNTIKEQVTIPSWFIEQTQLCYQWYPDDGLDECRASQRLLCSLPNSMTSYYLDDTDDSRGGCQMRWGIIASGQARWFQNVQICYRWYADGDARQCSHMTNGEFCARVNSYTSYYRDDTFLPPGGCQMSWRLIVPGAAPFWAHNIQLCFEWYASEDAGQCGLGASYSLCALANQWTAYYRDDTDNRRGGCYMRWGLKLT